MFTNVKIKVRIPNENVGMNLLDHIAVPLMPITIDQPVSLMPLRDYNLNEVMSFIREGKGTNLDLVFNLCALKYKLISIEIL